MKQERIGAILAAAWILFAPLAAAAATQIFSGAGEYVMEDNETLKEAQETAYAEAMRKIAQETAVYVTSRSAAKDATLTEDEIELMANAIMQVTAKEFQKELTPDGKLLIRAKVRAEVDEEATDRWLQERIAAREAERQYAEIKAQHDARQGELTDLEKKYSEARRGAAASFVAEGDALLAQGKEAEALARYNEAVEADPELAAGYARRGRLYTRQGKNDLARPDLEKAISLDNKSADAHYGLAVILDKAGASTRALAEYRAFVDCANIVEHGEEITKALERIAALGG